MVTLEEYAAQCKLSEDIELLECDASEDRDVWDQLRRELTVRRLRELRARRVSMGREPDDEVNAPADMCWCNVCLQGAPAKQFADGCPLHPRPEKTNRRLGGAQAEERARRMAARP